LRNDVQACCGGALSRRRAARRNARAAVSPARANVESELSLEKEASSSEKVLQAADLSSIFYIEIAGTEFAPAAMLGTQDKRASSRQRPAPAAIRLHEKASALVRNWAVATRSQQRAQPGRTMREAKKAAGTASRRADHGGV
jgi:hypothetical protein